MTATLTASPSQRSDFEQRGQRAGCNTAPRQSQGAPILPDRSRREGLNLRFWVGVRSGALDYQHARPVLARGMTGHQWGLSNRNRALACRKLARWAASCLVLVTNETEQQF